MPSLDNRTDLQPKILQQGAQRKPDGGEIECGDVAVAVDFCCWPASGVCLGNRGLVTTVSPRFRSVYSEYRFIAIRPASLSEPHRGEGRDQTKESNRTRQMRGGRHLYMRGQSPSRASCPSLRRLLDRLERCRGRIAESKALFYPTLKGMRQKDHGSVSRSSIHHGRRQDISCVAYSVAKAGVETCIKGRRI